MCACCRSTAMHPSSFHCLLPKHLPRNSKRRSLLYDVWPKLSNAMRCKVFPLIMCQMMLENFCRHWGLFDRSSSNWLLSFLPTVVFFCLVFHFDTLKICIISSSRKLDVLWIEPMSWAEIWLNLVINYIYCVFVNVRQSLEYLTMTTAMRIKSAVVTLHQDECRSENVNVLHGSSLPWWLG